MCRQQPTTKKNSEQRSSRFQFGTTEQASPIAGIVEPTVSTAEGTAQDDLVPKPDPLVDLVVKVVTRKHLLLIEPTTNTFTLKLGVKMANELLIVEVVTEEG